MFNIFGKKGPKKKKEPMSDIFDRQIDEIRAVKTQQQFNDTLDRHRLERRPLTLGEMKKYENLIYIYEDAVIEKRNELKEKFGEELVEDGDKRRAVGKLRF